MWCFSHIRTSKSGPSMCFFFTMFTSKRASCHNGVHLFNIATSKSVPSFFNTFDFEMCFAPQWRVFSTSQLPKVHRTCGDLDILTFKSASHLNVPMCSEHEVLLRFWLRKLLRATTACNCWSFICPDGSAPAALASLLFDPRGPQNVGKTQCFATFLPFRIPWSSFFCLSLLWSSFLFLSSLTLPTCAFHLSISSEVWLLNFPPLKKNIISIFPQAVCPHWGDLPVPESRLVLDRGTLGPWHFPCKFPHKWSLWDVHVRFDCASPRKVCAASFACSWPVAFYL